MIIIDRDLMNLACKVAFLHTVQESQLIKKSYSEEEIIKLAEWVKGLSYEESVSLISEYGIRDFENRAKTALKYGLAVVAGGLIARKGGGKAKIGAGIAAIVLYLYRKYTDPCVQRCMRMPSAEKKVCQLKCKLKATSTILRDVRAQIARCKNTKDPEKCKRGLTLVHMKWSKKHKALLTDLQLMYEKKKATNTVPTQESYGPPTKAHMTKRDRNLHRAKVVGVTAVPGGLSATFSISAIKKSFNFKCNEKCQKDPEAENKMLCYRLCDWQMTRYIVRAAEKELRRCRYAEHPEHCQKHMGNIIKSWRNKEEKAKHKLMLTRSWDREKRKKKEAFERRQVAKQYTPH